MTIKEDLEKLSLEDIEDVRANLDKIEDALSGKLIPERDLYRARKLKGLIDGLQYVGVIQGFKFEVRCYSGACWSYDKIWIKLPKNYHPKITEKIDQDLKNHLLKYIVKERERDEDRSYFDGTTAQPHELYIFYITEEESIQDDKR